MLATDWSLRAFDREGQQVWQQAIPEAAWGVHIPRGGKFVVAAFGDGTIRWHRLSDGQEVLALFVNAATREWVLWTPQGYYDCSARGADLIGWHLNNGWEREADFIAAARLKKDLHRPDIVRLPSRLPMPPKPHGRPGHCHRVSPNCCARAGPSRRHDRRARAATTGGIRIRPPAAPWGGLESCPGWCYVCVKESRDE